MITLKRIVNGANRGFVRLRKHVVQRLSYGGHPTLPVFVVGCQRSGTTMLQFALSQFPQVYNYGENDRPAFCDYRLARPEVIHRLIQKSRAHVLVFKPLCDSQYADNLLDEFSGRGLWIYRDYDDVINSSLRKFTQQKVVVEKLATGRWYGLGWNCERLSQHAVRTVERFYTPEMSRADACALMWYLRNLLFFERRLDVDGRVLLVKYEDLAGSADAWHDLLGFIGLPFDAGLLSVVHRSSIRKHEPPLVNPNLRSLCDELVERFDAIRRSTTRPLKSGVGVAEA